MTTLSLNTTLSILNFKCMSPMEPKLLPSAETPFLLVGKILSCCCIMLQNLNDNTLMDAPVSNGAAVCNSPICILYSAWKPSMKTLLMIASFAEGLSSQAEVSSESSAIMLSNSKKNLLSSSKLLSSEGMEILLT